MRYFSTIILLFCLVPGLIANQVTRQLQEVLNRGGNLVLEKGKVYNIDTTLILRFSGQQTYTADVTSIRNYATLRVVDPELVTVINAEGLAHIEIRDVRIDGNRDNMRPKAGKIPMQPFISLGKLGGDDQILRNCIITNARCSGGWAAIHVHENAFRCTIRDNIIFGAGTDVLGNGRSSLEYPFGWGDGISVAAANSTVKNNLIIDVTDEGIMVQGAPGTKVSGNVVVAFSREVLGGIALIDPAPWCLLDSLENTFDYRGIEVKNNIVYGLGARVHIAYPCGLDVWNMNTNKRILQGAEVMHNTIIGDIVGYGFAISGVKDFKVINNTANALFEEKGDGLPGKPPDDPAAFIYEADNTFESELQKEFIPAQKHIVHLLRNKRTPLNEAGYRLLDHYGEKEMNAIISIAFMEMLDRFPSAEEAIYWKNWMQETRSNADALRSSLMVSPEFANRNQAWRKSQLQECRVQLFMEELYRAFDEKEDASWPEADHVHRSLFSRYE